MRPIFGSRYKPEPPPPPAGDVGATGATCSWCMARLEGKPLYQGFFCSKHCAVAYMVTDPKKPEAHGYAA